MTAADPQLLANRCLELQSHIARLTANASPRADLPGLSLLGVGPAGIAEGMAQLEPRARCSVWNMQPHGIRFDPMDPYQALNERSRQRRLDLRLIIPEHTVDQNPLLACSVPQARVGPVHLPMIVIDRACLVLAGFNTPAGEPTVWTAVRRDLVEAACWIWDQTEAASRPLVPDGRPPLTERAHRVAIDIALGHKDAVIARELGVSLRTVTNDVEAVMRFLGARSRAEAVMYMHGRPPYGGVRRADGDERSPG